MTERFVLDMKQFDTLDAVLETLRAEVNRRGTIFVNGTEHGEVAIDAQSIPLAETMAKMGYEAQRNTLSARMHEMVKNSMKTDRPWGSWNLAIKDDRIAEVKAMRDGGMAWVLIAKHFGVGKAAVQRAYARACAVEQTG